MPAARPAPPGVASIGGAAVTSMAVGLAMAVASRGATTTAARVPGTRVRSVNEGVDRSAGVPLAVETTPVGAPGTSVLPGCANAGVAVAAGAGPASGSVGATTAATCVGAGVMPAGVAMTIVGPGKATCGAGVGVAPRTTISTPLLGGTSRAINRTEAWYLRAVA